MGVIRSHIARLLAPPATGGHAGTGTVGQGLDRFRGCGCLAQLLRSLRVKAQCSAAVRAVLVAAPIAGNGGQIGRGRVPSTHERGPAGFIQDAVVYVFEPVVPPAQGPLPPFVVGAGCAVFRPAMVPRANLCNDRCLGGSAHVHDEITVTVEQSADQIGRDLQRLLECCRFLAPKITILLLAQPSEQPGFLVEAVLEIRVINTVVRALRHGVIGINLVRIRIDVQGTINVVNVVVKQVRRAMRGNDRFQRRRFSVGHHQPVEGTPGNAINAHLAIGPGLFGELVDQLLGVRNLCLGILAGGNGPAAATGAAYVDPGHHIAPLGKVGTVLVIAQGEEVILAVRHHFHDDRKRLPDCRGCGAVVGDGQLHAVFHLKRLIFQRKRIARGVCRPSGTTRAGQQTGDQK